MNEKIEKAQEIVNEEYRLTQLSCDYYLKNAMPNANETIRLKEELDKWEIVKSALNQAEENEKELKDLREFSKIVVKKRVDVYSILMTVSCIEYNERISYYYPSLADKKYLKKLLLTEEEWQFLKKLMRKEEYGKKED